MGPVTLVPLDAGKGWTRPGVESFKLDPLFPGTAFEWVNRGTVMAIVAALLVIIFWLVMARGQQVVPGKRQFFGEMFYDQIRNGVARDVMGAANGRKYLPYLLGLFCFIWVNNLFGQFFLTMYPTFGNIGYAYGLAALTFIIYNAAGIQKHGLRYFKNMTVPAGVPWWLLPVIIPLEILSNFIVRPFTLALRLFANMFAGHLVIMVFVTGGAWLLLNGDGLVYRFSGGLSLVFSLAIFALELLVGLLQAYIFTVLTAQYIASSLAEDH